MWKEAIHSGMERLRYATETSVRTAGLRAEI
jgi:hypothetical protein